MNQGQCTLLSLVVLSLLGRISFAADPGPPQVQAAVDRLKAAVQGWSVHHVDQQPTVAVERQQGYRVILRSTWKEPPPGAVVQQQVAQPGRGEGDPTYLTRHTDWHFVLVPLGVAELSAEAKREILWHIPDEKQFRLPVAMGEGHGFAWFSYSSIPMQHFVREQLKLTGGDDRLQLVVRGLSVVDEGTNTRNSVTPLFVQFGKEGFVALEKLIQSNDNPYNAIQGLTYFRDAQATARLVQLYQSSNGQSRRAAAYALIHEPFRPEAKAAYLDMVRNQLLVHRAMAACEEFGWKEALPLIDGVVEKPSSLGAYRDAYQLSRKLSGQAIDPELLTAAGVIRGQLGTGSGSQPKADQVAAARQKIIQSTDVEGAVFIGFSLASFNTKGNTAPVKQDGMEILRALPRPVVDKMLNALANGIAETDRPAVIDVLRRLP